MANVGTDVPTEPSCANTYLFTSFSLLLALITFSLFHCPPPVDPSPTLSELCHPEPFICILLYPFHLNANAGIPKFTHPRFMVHLKHDKHFLYSHSMTPHLLFFSAYVCGSSRPWEQIKEGAEGHKMGRGQQMPQVKLSPMGSQRNKPANRHCERTPANIISQMHTFITAPQTHTHSSCYVRCISSE